MANAFVTAQEWIRDQLKSYVPTTVTYRRGGQAATFIAVVGTSLLKITDTGDGTVKMVRTDRDFIFDTSLLVFGGVATEPQVGDAVDETWPDEVTRRYTILSPGGAEPAWRYSDPHRIQFRVHTKYTRSL